MDNWQVERVIFEGYAPQLSGDANTAWEFTAVVGSGRRYPVYLVVANRLLRKHTGVAPGGPPPAELVPRLEAYVKRRLEHPAVRDRHPTSLRGVQVPVNHKAEWQEVISG